MPGLLYDLEQLDLLSLGLYLVDLQDQNELNITCCTVSNLVRSVYVYPIVIAEVEP